jgi:hypothetical protein
MTNDDSHTAVIPFNNRHTRFVWQIELAVVRPRPEEFFAFLQTTY